MLLKRVLSFLLFLVVFSACTRDREIQEVMDIAGTNRPELEKLIQHYKSENSKEKLAAAYFLVGNMKNKLSFDGAVIKNFDVLFDIADSLHKKKIKFGNNSPFFQHKWDSLANLYGIPSIDDAEELKDPEQVRADYLIRHIDYAFRIWNEQRAGSKMNFSEFCEFLLPYRIGNEILEPWLKEQYTRYKVFRDTTKARSRIEYARTLNLILKPTISTNHSMWSYPFDLPASKVQKSGIGACRHLVYYTAMVMRANGLPVGVDMAPTWGNRDKGHLWNTLLTEDGRRIPFDAGKGVIEGHDMFVYKFAKAFRLSFSPQDIELPGSKLEVPLSLLDPNLIDVTKEYTKTYDLAVPISLKPGKEKKYAVICTFGNGEWVPQDWGKIAEGTARFKSMGSDILYKAMYFDGGEYSGASEPFVLTKAGRLRYFSKELDKRQDMILYRKFGTFKPQLLNWMKVLNGKLQGANKADFSDSVTLYTIKQIPEKLEEAQINDPRKFRYIRYLSPEQKPASIAELEIYTKSEGRELKKEGRVIGEPSSGTEYPLANAFDGDLGTYFYGKGTMSSHGWVGLDLGRPVRISKVRYCPQSDTNFILVGDEYQLFYWDRNTWVSAGRQIAKEQFLQFKDVPQDRLYILRNLSRGKEERIFTYENGKQVWW